LSPFVSLFLDKTDEKNRKEVQQAAEESKSLLIAFRPESAKASLRSALRIDSTYALAWFKLAQCYDVLGRYDSAALAYGKARDCDGLRFRAPSKFNTIVRRVATNSHSLLADVDSAFRAQSPQGIIGNELLWEHVHPRLHGYGILAKVWYEALLKTTVGGQSGRRYTALSDSTVDSALHLTSLDEAFGQYKMERLKNRWPFVGTGNTISDAPLNDTTRVVKLFLDGKLRWNEAHYEMADVYLKKRDFSSAAKEYEAVSEFYREDPFPLMRAGDMHVALKRHAEGVHAYERAIAISDNQFVQLKLGVVLIELQRPQSALEHLMRSVKLDAQASQKFSRAQKSEAAYYYALALSQIGRKTESVQILSMILEQNSNDQRALQLLREIRKK
jgi:tetratricopeptide (TPR) repeat protein